MAFSLGQDRTSTHKIRFHCLKSFTPDRDNALLVALSMQHDQPLTVREVINSQTQHLRNTGTSTVQQLDESSIAQVGGCGGVTCGHGVDKRRHIADAEGIGQASTCRGRMHIRSHINTQHPLEHAKLM